jgi:hypothetical protein
MGFSFVFFLRLAYWAFVRKLTLSAHGAPAEEMAGTVATWQFYIIVNRNQSHRSGGIG